jgi:hypothetical protein
MRHLPQADWRYRCWRVVLEFRRRAKRKNPARSKIQSAALAIGRNA